MSSVFKSSALLALKIRNANIGHDSSENHPTLPKYGEDLIEIDWKPMFYSFYFEVFSLLFRELELNFTVQFTIDFLINKT